MIACKGIDYATNVTNLEGSSCRLYGDNKVRSDPGSDNREYCSLTEQRAITKTGIDLKDILRQRL